VVKFIKFTHKLYERFASAVRKKKNASWSQIISNIRLSRRFLAALLSFSCSDKYPTYWQPLLFL